MKKYVGIAIVASLFFSSASAAVINPHIDTADRTSCEMCHKKDFDPNKVREGDYFLLESTIDAVCLRCHIKAECCVIGQKHSDPLSIGNSHPSDLEASRVNKESLPRTLSLHEDKITCNTCHFHRKPSGQEYKMVRLVTFKDTGVEWTALCADCHSKY